MPEGIGGWAGWIVAALVAVFTFVSNMRKTDVDQSAIILGKWKELVEQHEKTLATLNREIDSLRERLVAAESGLVAANKRITELETENAALKRAIAQNSQSTAVLLKPNRAIDDDAAKLERAGDNIRKGVR